MNYILGVSDDLLTSSQATTTLQAAQSAADARSGPIAGIVSEYKQKESSRLGMAGVTALLDEANAAGSTSQLTANIFRANDELMTLDSQHTLLAYQRRGRQPSLLVAAPALDYFGDNSTDSVYTA